MADAGQDSILLVLSSGLYRTRGGERIPLEEARLAPRVKAVLLRSFDAPSICADEKYYIYQVTVDGGTGSASPRRQP